MSNRQTYQKYLKSKCKTESDVSRILDATESGSLFAALMAGISNQDISDDVHRLFSTIDWQNINASTNEILIRLNKGIVEKYSISSSVFVGAYPTTSFDGVTETVEDESLILVNEGALQLIGGTVQLFYSQLGPLRKAQELVGLIEKYVESLHVPENSAFSGSWANFSFERYQKEGR